ncbi:hypothetical protein AB0C51_19455 [Streptomyces pathocidini]|uniref:hypothetical protein n=1 Tax=Streptomyces pathocidini TaxID=1650571 RepID=UPI0034040E70
MNPPSGHPAPHLDPREAGKGQDQEAERATSQWRSQRAAARRVVAGYSRDSEDLAFLLEALELHPDTDGLSYGSGPANQRGGSGASDFGGDSEHDRGHGSRP